MVGTIIKVLASMYLAGVILNTIQINKIFMKLEKTRFRMSRFLLFFLYVFVHPRSVIIGTILTLKDCDWMEGKIRKNESGHFEAVTEVDKDND